LAEQALNHISHSAGVVVLQIDVYLYSIVWRAHAEIVGLGGGHDCFADQQIVVESTLRGFQQPEAANKQQQQQIGLAGDTITSPVYIGQMHSGS